MDDAFYSPLDLDHEAQGSSRSSTARLQPKLKGKSKVKPKSSSVQEPTPLPVQTADVSENPVTALCLEVCAEESTSEPMEVDNEEDVVVQEIDVFRSASPLHEGAQLYVMQYPLRPYWRPYELEQRCEEVKVKPKQSKVEVVLSIDVDSKNYDKKAPEPLRIDKQILSSSRTGSVTNRTIGILTNNQLHLSPVHSVLQLRPSMEHLNNGGLQKKHENLEIGAKSDKVKLVPKDLSGNMDDTEELWVSLEYSATESSLSSEYRQKMWAQQDEPVRPTMGASDYANSIFPGSSNVRKAPRGPSASFMTSKTLEERLKGWLKICQVNRFNALMHLDLTIRKEDFLKMLQDHAYLVQGLWVSKSSLLYEGHEATLRTQRDYILLLFSKKNVIHFDELKKLGLGSNENRILSPLACKRPLLKGWKLKEDSDLSFIKEHQDVVNQQEYAWSHREKDLVDSLSRVGRRLPVMTKNAPNPNMARRSTTAGNSGTGSSAADAMSNESHESLSKALLQIFSDRKARSINSIRQEIQRMALSKSSRPKEDPRTKALVHAVSNNLRSCFLQDVLDQIAVKVHDVYVLKYGENTTINPLRNVVIDLFRGKGCNAKLKKQEIKQAAQIALKGDISDTEYNQVMNDLCVLSKGAWILKLSPE